MSTSVKVFTQHQLALNNCDKYILLGKYHIGTHGKTWNEAADHCAGKRMSLAFPPTKKAVHALCTASPYKYIWFDIKIESTIKGQPNTFTHYDGSWTKWDDQGLSFFTLPGLSDFTGISCLALACFQEKWPETLDSFGTLISRQCDEEGTKDYIYVCEDRCKYHSKKLI